MWVPPGGHADPGESMIECARRELREESDYNARHLHYLTSYDCSAEGWPVYRLTIFWSRYDGVQACVCREGQALAFIERSMAAGFTIPDHLLNAWDSALIAARQVETTLT